jgi:hypothetical protein
MLIENNLLEQAKTDQDRVLLVNNTFNTNFTTFAEADAFVVSILKETRIISVFEEISNINQPLVVSIKSLFDKWAELTNHHTVKFCPFEPIARMILLLDETKDCVMQVPANVVECLQQQTDSIPVEFPKPPIMNIIPSKNFDENMQQLIDAYKYLYNYLDEKEDVNVQIAKIIQEILATINNIGEINSL